MRWMIIWATAGLVGMSFGLGLGLAWWSVGRNAAGSPIEMKQRAQQQNEPRTGDEQASLQLADVQERLSNLERFIAARVTPSASAPGTAELPITRSAQSSSSEQERHIVIAERDKQIRAFEAESYDPAWSTIAKSAFQQDLDAITVNKDYKVKSLDCKTTLCRAVVSWASYDEAQSAAGHFMHAMYHTNCAKTLYAPKPEDPNAPYEGTIIYDCTSLRARNTL